MCQATFAGTLAPPGRCPACHASLSPTLPAATQKLTEKLTECWAHPGATRSGRVLGVQTLPGVSLPACGLTRPRVNSLARVQTHSPVCGLARVTLGSVHKPVSQGLLGPSVPLRRRPDSLLGQTERSGVRPLTRRLLQPQPRAGGAAAQPGRLGGAPCWPEGGCRGAGVTRPRRGAACTRPSRVLGSPDESRARVSEPRNTARETVSGGGERLPAGGSGCPDAGAAGAGVLPAGLSPPLPPGSRGQQSSERKTSPLSAVQRGPRVHAQMQAQR